jgi:hypothetical protein
MRRNKTRKGGYYGFAGDVTGSSGSGSALWQRGAEVTQNVGDRNGNAFYGASGGRRRKSKKARSRRRTRRRMRGGVSFGQSVAGFTGASTQRGMGGYSDVSDPGGKAALGSFANHGAQPGSSWSNYMLNK